MAIRKSIFVLVLFSFIHLECFGDLNQDDLVDVFDIIILINNILNQNQIDILNDLNNDSELNILDIIIVANTILNVESPCIVFWGQETNILPNYYFTSDIDDFQIDRVINYYNIARLAWGNWGPLEFWIVGTDISEAESLDSTYCYLRTELNSCLDDNYLQWCLNREYSFTDYAVNGGAGLSLMREFEFNCSGYSYMEITLSSQFPFPNESDYDVVTMHEYFHAYQHAHIFTFDYNERANLMVINPWWSEGGAEYMAQLLYSQQAGVNNNYLRQVMEWKMQSKNDLFDGELISDIPYGPRAYIAYDLGTWAIAYLINLVGLETYKNDFYNDLNEHGWEQSFNINFNMSSDQFLSEFHNFLSFDIDEQLNIIP
tara:strand:- start:334 stop:1449 length:1116 start_codon:yes stop_codon:yes gene_type:complete